MRTLLSLLVVLGFSVPGYSDLVDRPDGHAPIGVMGEHGHKKGELMVSVRAMYMSMKDMLDGTDTVNAEDVFDSTSFMMAPEKMDMWMYMLGGMYGITDKWTVMVMLPYVTTDMTVARDMQNDTIQTESSGIGDVSVSGLYTITETDSVRMLVTLGAFLPTGALDFDRNGTRLGYPMQIGSGSYALQPGFVYSVYGDSYSVGSQVQVKNYLNDNSEDYRRGTEYLLNVWGSYAWCENFSNSLRLSYKAVDPMDGADDEINSMMAPTNRTDYQHGNTAMLHVGGNWLGTEFAKGHRIGLEIGMPIYQDLSGPQMKTGLVGTLGWQKAF